MARLNLLLWFVSTEDYMTATIWFTWFADQGVKSSEISGIPYNWREDHKNRLHAASSQITKGASSGSRQTSYSPLERIPSVQHACYVWSTGAKMVEMGRLPSVISTITHAPHRMELAEPFLTYGSPCLYISQIRRVQENCHTDSHLETARSNQYN